MCRSGEDGPNFGDSVSDTFLGEAITRRKQSSESVLRSSRTKAKPDLLPPDSIFLSSQN